MSIEKYNAGARTLHWAIAILILLNLALGILHEPLENVVRLMPLHMSVGLTVLVLSLVRFAWRATWNKPPYPATVSPTEATLARTLHAILYFLMIAMPLTGWMMVSGGRHPLSWFGILEVPKLPFAQSEAVGGVSHEFHVVAGWVLLVLAIGHILAALRHQFLLKDNLLRRMA